MFMMLSYGIFAGALGVSVYAIAGTIMPRLDRILAALRRQPQSEFHPLATLVKAERRIALRRWASQSRPVPTIRSRAAA